MKIFTISTPAHNVMINITDEVKKAVKELKISDGIITVYCPHTTAGICINENADPDVQRDMLEKLSALIPADPKYAHSEGNSDAHIKSALVGSSAQVIVENGKLQLGTWQAVYFCEFDGPRSRDVWIK